MASPSDAPWQNVLTGVDLVISYATGRELGCACANAPATESEMAWCGFG